MDERAADVRLDGRWVESPERFSLLGGPLHRTGRRLRLVRGDTNTVLLGLALGGGLWVIVVTLALMQGVADRLFSLSVVGGHARLLLIIPLFFICESWIDPRMGAFVATLTKSGVVPPSARTALAARLAATRRWADAWWPEAACLIAAVLVEITGSRLQTYGATAVNDPARTALSALVYFHFGLTLFRFLLFRWAWKLALWSWLLWRVSRLDLRLIPGHPDRAGGLGTLEGVHERFTPLVAAFSVLESASLAESIATGTLAATAVYPTLALLLVIDGALFLAPMLVFTDKLWAARTKGIDLYMGLAESYVTGFEAKWTRNVATNEPLLGTPDVQSLADLGNAIGVVQSLRWITAGPRLLSLMTMAAVVPLAPLILFQYPIAELAQKVFSSLIGL